MTSLSKGKLSLSGIELRGAVAGALLQLSHQELDCVQVIQAVVDRGLSQAQAAERLQLSTRQIKRLIRCFRADGAVGLASRRRGRPSNNRIEAVSRAEHLGVVRTHYPDFGPTFAHDQQSRNLGIKFEIAPSQYTCYQ